MRRLAPVGRILRWVVALCLFAIASLAAVLGTATFIFTRCTPPCGAVQGISLYALRQALIVCALALLRSEANGLDCCSSAACGDGHCWRVSQPAACLQASRWSRSF